MQTLHILNGDATLNGFEQTGLDGDIMIWREVLSEGPVLKSVASAAFWEGRSAWISKTFNITEEQYHENTIQHLEKLNEPYEEINLWFEYDLHCQINLLAVMMLLEQQTNLSAPEVYLISPADFPDMPDFAGMGELDGEQLEYVYDNNRLHLSEYDFVLATEAWEIYVCRDAARLQNWLDKTPFWGNMHSLKPAMEAHLKRLQIDADGLNYIHQTLLAIYNSGLRTKPEIYASFWKTEKIYGMGDSEMDLYLQLLTNKGLIQLK